MLLPLSATEQGEVISQCNRFKQRAQQHARLKKQTMQRCYAYFKSQFFGDDLLPTPAALGAENDANSNRPEIFIPVVREQLKLLYAQIKLTLFPNDEDYFRIRGKNPIAAMNENDLTEALKYLFKDACLTEKLGKLLIDTLWAGFAVAHPTFYQESRWTWQWQADPLDPSLPGQMMPVISTCPPVLDVELWNPLAFYIDPDISQQQGNSAWGYFAKRPVSQLMEAPWTLNKDLLKNSGSKSSGDELAMFELNEFNELMLHTNQGENMVRCDQYYFPYLMVGDQEFRNILVSVVNGNILAEFRPNMMPKGLSPVVFCTWMDDRESPYGTGPAEDMKDLQRLINILYNYQIETFARIGNRFIVKEGVDLTNFFGLAGGVATAQNPQTDMVSMNGDYIETVHLANLIGTLKAEAQLVAGTQNPFQGSSTIDFKKTATEIQLLQENSISVIREIIEHITLTGIQPILERLMLLAADLFNNPMQLRVDRNGSASQFLSIDLSVLKSGDYTIELIGFNPSQSKQAQVESLMRLIELVSNNPDLLIVAEPLIIQIGVLWGLKDIHQLVADIKNRMNFNQPAMYPTLSPQPRSTQNGHIIQQ